MAWATDPSDRGKQLGVSLHHHNGAAYVLHRKDFSLKKYCSFWGATIALTFLAHGQLPACSGGGDKYSSDPLSIQETGTSAIHAQSLTATTSRVWLGGNRLAATTYEPKTTYHDIDAYMWSAHTVSSEGSLFGIHAEGFIVPDQANPRFATINWDKLQSNEAEVRIQVLVRAGDLSHTTEATWYGQDGFYQARETVSIHTFAMIFEMPVTEITNKQYVDMLNWANDPNGDGDISDSYLDFAQTSSSADIRLSNHSEHEASATWQAQTLLTRNLVAHEEVIFSDGSWSGRRELYQCAPTPIF